MAIVVQKIRVTIALNVVKAKNLVQMKLISHTVDKELPWDIVKILTFWLYANMAALNTEISLTGKRHENRCRAFKK